jgi:hypothetical protein
MSAMCVSAARTHRRKAAAVLLATFAWLGAAAAEDACAAPAPHCCMQVEGRHGDGAPCAPSRACLSAFDECSCADPPLARSAASERPAPPAQGIALLPDDPAPRPRATPPARAPAAALAARHLAHSTVVLLL